MPMINVILQKKDSPDTQFLRSPQECLKWMNMGVSFGGSAAQLIQ